METLDTPQILTPEQCPASIKSRYYSGVVDESKGVLLYPSGAITLIPRRWAGTPEEFAEAERLEFEQKVAERRAKLTATHSVRVQWCNRSGIQHSGYLRIEPVGKVYTIRVTLKATLIVNDETYSTTFEYSLPRAYAEIENDHVCLKNLRSYGRGLGKHSDWVEDLEYQIPAPAKGSALYESYCRGWKIGYDYVDRYGNLYNGSELITEDQSKCLFLNHYDPEMGKSRLDWNNRGEYKYYQSWSFGLPICSQLVENKFVNPQGLVTWYLTKQALQN